MLKMTLQLRDYQYEMKDVVSINVIKEMTDTGDEFKECHGFSWERWKDSLKLCALINCF